MVAAAAADRRRLFEQQRTLPYMQRMPRYRIVTIGRPSAAKRFLAHRRKLFNGAIPTGCRRTVEVQGHVRFHGE